MGETLPESLPFLLETGQSFCIKEPTLGDSHYRPKTESPCVAGIGETRDNYSLFREDGSKHSARNAAELRLRWPKNVGIDRSFLADVERGKRNIPS